LNGRNDLKMALLQDYLDSINDMKGKRLSKMQDRRRVFLYIQSRKKSLAERKTKRFNSIDRITKNRITKQQFNAHGREKLKKM